jgi:predicted signal transduction protein with EAL and GGDEF domain
MVDIVMRLGHQLGLEVIAEGVTTRTELAAVVAAGCRFGQGALFGWGVPAEHLEALLETATSPAARRAPEPAQRLPWEASGQLTAGAGGAPERDTPKSVNQNVGSVDSSREMRKA